MESLKVRLGKIIFKNPKVYLFYRGLKQRFFPQNKIDYEFRVVPGIYGRVHKFDFMIAGDHQEAVDAYNRIGSLACQQVEEALRLTNRTNQQISSLLDFGSGYGRVTRVFVQRFPAKAVTVYDLDPGAVRFCVSEFKVKGIYPAIDPIQPKFGKYDVIWLGSVFTHLSEAYTRETFKMLDRMLKPNGVLIFTTHGADTFERLSQGYYGEYWKNLSEKIVSAYQANDFAFYPYSQNDIEILPFNFPRKNDFGMTWMKQAYVENMIQSASNHNYKALMYKPLGWDGHQDVHIYQKLK